jgi:tetratricopeptide (TPR) repeat protein
MPNVAIYYGNRGNSYYAQEDYERAITDYSKAIQIAPEDGQYYYARGNSYIASDNRALARDDYKRAVQLGYEQAREELGLIDNLILTIIKIIFSWRLLLLYLIILLKSFHFC